MTRYDLVFGAALLLCAPLSVARADTEQGSTGCTVVTQAAADAIATRIQSDDSSIAPPQSVTALSCLDNFFSGLGLDIFAKVLDPSALIDAVEGKICAAVKSTWNNLMGGAQCGLTLNGFDIGFGGLGLGVMCPKLSFGGSGPTWATLNATGVGFGGDGLYINGSPVPPSGYALPANSGAW